ncbi:MAG: GntR family transcriptional regulator [Caldilinea sp. CFX5]|nr:GntR family transcriptional regulator [Caldilinea sp. CFX5]
MELLRDNIKQGVWWPGVQLPGEHALCANYGVSRTVVRQALGELAAEGLIVRHKGKGAFVAEPKISESLAQKLTGFYQDMSERGHRPISQVLVQAVQPAPVQVARHLGLPAATPVVHLRRLRFVQNEPIVLVSSYLPHALCPGLEQVDFRAQSLYAYLERQYGLLIARGRRRIEAVVADEQEAKLLQVPVGAPLLLLDSVSYLDDNRPLEYYHAVHRGDRSQFEVELVRIREQGQVRETLRSTLADLPRSNELRKG